MSSQSAPLHGQKILLTRSHEALPLLSEQLQAAGATVLAVPLIEVELLPVSCPDWTAYDWVFITSKNAVDGFFQSMPASSSPVLPLAVLGAATAEAVMSYGNAPTFVGPSVGGVEAVHAFWNVHGCPGLRVLWPCGSLARKEIKTAFETLGALVTPWEVYQTRLRTALSPTETTWIESTLDWILFTSPSAVESFACLQRPLLPSTGIACIGVTTAQAVARLLGRSADVVPETASQETLIGAILRHGPRVSVL